MKTTTNYTWKLGLFVIIGLVMLIIAIYFVGKNQNLFGSTFHLNTQFKNVGGLNIGNNVRFSGINIGTVKEIKFISDSSVVVRFIVKKEVQQYIKTDAIASIGSDGLMGDKVLIISPGTASNDIVKNNATIASVKAIEMEDLMKGLNKSVENAQLITQELAEFSYKINRGKGALNKVLTDENFAKSIDGMLTNLNASSTELMLFTQAMNNKNGTLSKLMTNPNYANSIERSLQNLEKSTQEITTLTEKLNNNKGILSKLISDERLATSLDTTLTNIEKGAKNLLEIEAAAKNNFLLRGYFKKQKKEELKKKEALLKAENN